MDTDEFNLRMNSSFSPSLPEGWDSSLHDNGLHRGIHRASTSRSSLSSNGNGSRRGGKSDKFPNHHHHSVSDGALTYLGSPSDSFQPPRWTPPDQTFDLVARPQAFQLSHHSEIPHSEPCQWASSSKHENSPPARNLPGRRSFMSKPVYPIIFHNPVSHGEASGSSETRDGKLIPPIDFDSIPTSSERNLSPDLGLYKVLTELEKSEFSPETSVISRREGFRLSNASSYDVGFEESLRSPYDMADKSPKCGLCERFLRHKSPWSSCRIVRNSNMPTTAVLSCGHIFHADCLEESTPKTQVQDPTCPLCVEKSSSSSSITPLHSSLKANRTGSDYGGPSWRRPDISQKRSFSLRGGGGGCGGGGVFSMKDRFKRGFPFKGKKLGRDLFRMKDAHQK